MGILDSFERALERGVNAAFAKTFRSGLQPVELTSALRRELDTKAAVVSRDRILVPNAFHLRLAPADYQRMRQMGSTLTDELTAFVTKHAAQQRYQFAGAVSIELEQDGQLSTGILEIDSSNLQQTDVSWTPVVDVNGRRYPLLHARTVIGRGTDADITVDDTGISRKHIEIAWDGAHAQVRDLDSTNGSHLNGRLLDKALLNPGDVVTLGRTRVVFNVVPQQSQPRPRSVGGFWGEQ